VKPVPSQGSLFLLMVSGSSCRGLVLSLVGAAVFASQCFQTQRLDLLFLVAHRGLRHDYCEGAGSARWRYCRLGMRVAKRYVPLATNAVHNSLPVAVNWHLEPHCNFACKFCFAQFKEAKQPGAPKGLHMEESLTLLHNLRAAGADKITFVGGEPMLHKDICDLIKRAKLLGFTTCMVTNGSLLNKFWLKHMQHHLDWLGISIDASSDALHVAIGRASKRDIDRGASTNLEHLKNMWKLAKTLGYGLKLNTVVSRPTLDHDMSQLVVELLPDRWKVFQVLPVRG